MNVQAKKYQFIEWITNIQDTKLIKLVKIAEDSDWWDYISETEKLLSKEG